MKVNDERNVLELHFISLYVALCRGATYWGNSCHTSVRIDEKLPRQKVIANSEYYENRKSVSHNFGQ